MLDACFSPYSVVKSSQVVLVPNGQKSGCDLSTPSGTFMNSPSLSMGDTVNALLTSSPYSKSPNCTAIVNAVSVAVLVATGEYSYRVWIVV